MIGCASEYSDLVDTYGLEGNRHLLEGVNICDPLQLILRDFTPTRFAA